MPGQAVLPRLFQGARRSLVHQPHVDFCGAGFYSCQFFGCGVMDFAPGWITGGWVQES